MMRRIKYLALSTVLLSGFQMNSQELHYSQFYNMLPAINPAATGAFGGDYRFIIDYRSSKYSAASPFTTFYGSYDMGIAKYKKDGFARQSFFGAGLSLLKDKAGEGALSLQEISLMLSYNLRIGESNYLSLGFRGGTSTRSINYDNLKWGTQYDPGSGSYDPSAFADPLVGNTKATFAPIGAGLLWNFSKVDVLKINAGVGMNRLNEPEAAFDSKLSETLPMQLVANLAAEWMVPKTSMSLIPHFLFTSQSYYDEFSAGLLIKYYISFDSKMTHIKKSSAAYIGAFYRNSQDMVIITKFDLRRNIGIGLSYDIDMSALSDPTTVKQRGALEFLITYSSFFKEKSLLPKKGSDEFF